MHSNPFKLFGNDDTGYSFKAQTVAGLERFIVISMPKSGTYLLARLLAELGLIDLEIHLANQSFSDYRFMSTEEKLRNSSRVNKPVPLSVTSSYVNSGQLAVGHLIATADTVRMLREFRKIVSIRDARAVLVSAMRFEMKRIAADRDWHAGFRDWVSIDSAPARLAAFTTLHGKGYLDLARHSIDWATVPDVYVVRYEDLVGESGEDRRHAVLAGLSRYGSLPTLGTESYTRVFFADTLTFSGGAVALNEYWSKDTEDMFTKFGGRDINASLGYPTNM